jgi:hypothetical protein
MNAAIDEIKNLVISRFPEATFAIVDGKDPEGVHLVATVDLDDMDEVVDLFIDRLVEFQVDEGLALYVIPVRPVERNAAIVAQRNVVAGAFIAL